MSMAKDVITVTGKRILNDGSVYYPEWGDDLSKLLAKTEEIYNVEADGGGNGGNEEEEDEEKIKERNRKEAEKARSILERIIAQFDKLVDKLSKKFEGGAYLEEGGKRKKIILPDGTEIIEEEDGFSFCIGNGEFDCANMKLERIKGQKQHNGLRLEISQLYRYQDKTGKEYLIRYEDDIARIIINYENGDETMVLLTDLFGARPNIDFSCGNLAKDGQIYTQVIDKNADSGRTYRDLECRYGDLKLVRVGCDAGYNPGAFNTCKPASCGRLAHGSKSVRKITNCYRGIKQYTYENCSYGKISLSYEESLCPYDTIIGPETLPF